MTKLSKPENDALVREAANEIERLGLLVETKKSLHEYTDAEIGNEWHRRAMMKLGDQRVGVGVPLSSEKS